MPLPEAYPPEQVGAFGASEFPGSSAVNAAYARVRLTGGKVAFLAIVSANNYNLYIYEPTTNESALIQAWNVPGATAPPMLVENGSGFRVIQVDSDAAEITFRDYDADGAATGAAQVVSTGLVYPELGKPCDMGGGKSLMPAVVDTDPFSFVGLILSSDGTFVTSAALESKAFVEFELDFTPQAVRFAGQDAALVIWNEGATARPTLSERGVYGAVVSSAGSVLAAYTAIVSEAQLEAIDADWGTNTRFCWLSASEPSGAVLLLVRLIDDVSGHRTPVMRRVTYSAGAVSFPATVAIPMTEETSVVLDWSLSIPPDGRIFVNVSMVAGEPGSEAEVFELNSSLAVIDSTRTSVALNIQTASVGNPIVGLSVGWEGFLAFSSNQITYSGTDYDPAVLRFGVAADAETTCGAFLCEAFSDAFYVCEDCRADEPPDVWLPSTPQIPRRAETLPGAAGADTLPERAPEPPSFRASDDAIADIRAALIAGRIGALEQMLELARRDAQDVEDVEILMLAA